MGFWSRLFGIGDVHQTNQRELMERSVQKSVRLHEISLALGGAHAAGDLLGGASAKARDDLFDMVEQDTDLSQIMAKHAASRKDLDDIWFRLKAAGAGQWADEHYVLASALAFGPTLHYVLSNRNDGDWSTIAGRLVQYFGDGEVGFVE